MTERRSIFQSLPTDDRFVLRAPTVTETETTPSPSTETAPTAFDAVTANRRKRLVTELTEKGSRLVKEVEEIIAAHITLHGTIPTHQELAAYLSQRGTARSSTDQDNNVSTTSTSGGSITRPFSGTGSVTMENGSSYRYLIQLEELN